MSTPMTVQQLRDFLANETVDNDAEVYIIAEDDRGYAVHAAVDDDGDFCLYTYEEE